MTSSDDLAARLIVQGSRFARTASTAAGETRSIVGLRTLSNLDHHGAMRLSLLVELERISQPAMTKAVNKLESEGLIRRTPDPEDARASLISITDAGRTELQTFRSRSAAAVAPRLAALSDADRAALVRAADIMEQLSDQIRPHAP